MKINSEFKILGFDSPYEDADIVVFGAPFDGTVSFRPGSRFGPSAIRNESYGIETYSPYQDKDMTDLKGHDLGDLDLPFGDTQQVLRDIGDCARRIVRDQKKFIMLGGEHLVTLPAVEAVLEAFPDLCIIHLDAHTDLRDDYLGVKLSHATVIRRVWEKVGDNRIWQYGIRSGEREEFQWARQHTFLTPFVLDGVEKAIQEIGRRPVYLTIDLDVLDPSAFPGTGTPEHGGVTFRELMNFLVKLTPLDIKAADLVELAPHYDHSGISTAAACKLLRELALIL
ncbi:agmatinase [Thermoclostridium caenicola]|uniref:Agmatinase n=1 Tax=Thermoclostridium caenicola TaxID=659425 RepID=A0A1M6FNJ3_9FIRM|nr:agmatinase [Thermoclostridium caenicola]SHI99235.1 agmatinase [Thermoclostridium caenicola]HOP73109.1 agmatinase [Thermoclostridium caenicola]HPU21917.1 agmatinase [Thermoclostridium caenicola]